MSGHDDARRLVERMFDAFNRRALDEMLELAHPEIELRPLRLSGTDVWRGHDGVIELYERFRRRGLTHRMDIAETRVLEDGRVVALGTVRLDEDVMPFVAVHVIREGRIAVAEHYFSDDALLRSLGLLPR